MYRSFHPEQDVYKRQGFIRVHEHSEFDMDVWSTISEDGGNTWSVPKQTGMTGAPPHLLRHSSGAIVCLSLIHISWRRLEFCFVGAVFWFYSGFRKSVFTQSPAKNPFFFPSCLPYFNRFVQLGIVCHRRYDGCRPIYG